LARELPHCLQTKNVDAALLQKVTGLLTAGGAVVHLTEQTQLQGVTALSGSVPGYVFATADAMQRSATALGLSNELSRMLVHQTIHGAGLMLAQPNVIASELQNAVTSKGRTTAAGLAVFNAPEIGIIQLMQATVIGGAQS
jgi:pyrroline-5-carboxylate reductase